MKTIAVLTSGGDAPGMNAAIRAVVRTGLDKGLKGMGIQRGYSGLIHGEIFEMDRQSVADIIHRGGTSLGKGPCEGFKNGARRKKGGCVPTTFGIGGGVSLGGGGILQGGGRERV